MLCGANNVKDAWVPLLLLYRRPVNRFCPVTLIIASVRGELWTANINAYAKWMESGEIPSRACCGALNKSNIIDCLANIIPVLCGCIVKILCETAAFKSSHETGVELAFDLCV